MARAKFIIKARAGVEKAGWYWLLVGANGEVICHSESFEYPTDAREAAKNARRLARLAKVER